MKTPIRITLASLLWLALAALLPAQAPAAAPGFHKAGAKAFKASVPREFYLEGNAIPVERYHTALLLEGRKQFIVGLLATSGYSSDVRQKYLGMMIAETPVSLNGVRLEVGSYGFGLAPVNDAGKRATVLRIYNQAGAQVGKCTAHKDLKLRHPMPLEVLVEKGGARVRIYFGRYWVTLHG